MSMTATSDELRHIRSKEFPFTASALYMNAASAGPLPVGTGRAIDGFNRQRTFINEMKDAEFGPILDRSRTIAARLIGGEASEIALGANTSFGINLAAQALPVRDGSTILVSDREFPANVYPWMERSGAILELLPTDAEGFPDEARLMERLDEGDVSIFALSAVQFANGYRADLARFGSFCRERGIYFVVDAIQALGQVPLDVREMKIDVLATGGHKWLLSPFGAGFAYIRKELLDSMQPDVIGWSSMVASEDLASLLEYRYELQPDARKFEVGTPAFQDFVGFSESVDLLLEVGIPQIEEHLFAILSPLRSWLASREKVDTLEASELRHRSAILCFRPPNAGAVYERLTAAGVACALREGAIRLSPHLYNTADEIVKVVEILEECEARGWT